MFCHHGKTRRWISNVLNLTPKTVQSSDCRYILWAKTEDTRKDTTEDTTDEKQEDTIEYMKGDERNTRRHEDTTADTSCFIELL